MRETYGEKAYYPPGASYEFLIQRVQNAMNDCGGRCRIICDDMTGKNAKGREYRLNLTRQHATMRNNGSRLSKTVVLRIDRIGTLDFTPSEADERIQLADLVAYAAYRQFVDFGPDWEKEEGRLPLYDYFGRLAKKFRQGPGARIQGYGIVKAPRRGRRLWSVGVIYKE